MMLAEVFVRRETVCYFCSEKCKPRQVGENLAGLDV
jgi:hypothetical protein